MSDTPDRSKTTVAEVGEVINALRNAAAFLNERGGYTRIDFSYDGGGYEKTWTVKIVFTGGGEGAWPAHGKTLEAAVSALADKIEGELRGQEDKLKRSAGLVRENLRVARGQGEM